MSSLPFFALAIVCALTYLATPLKRGVTFVRPLWRKEDVGAVVGDTRDGAHGSCPSPGSLEDDAASRLFVSRVTKSGTDQIDDSLGALVAATEDVLEALPETLCPDEELVMLAALGAQQRALHRLVEVLSVECE